jgi:hypothetical protein
VVKSVLLHPLVVVVVVVVFLLLLQLLVLSRPSLSSIERIHMREK